MENSPNPMSQLPQLLEALLIRLEGMLAEQTQDPVRRKLTEDLLSRLRKQTRVMQAVTNTTGGEGLTPEMEALVNLPITMPPIFPSWASDKKEGK
jgi:hypothetical protein